jgi:hypothetical protein
MKLLNCFWPSLAAGYAFGTNNSCKRNGAGTKEMNAAKWFRPETPRDF